MLKDMGYADTPAMRAGLIANEGNIEQTMRELLGD